MALVAQAVESEVLFRVAMGVKNKREASCLIRISTVANRLDQLLAAVEGSALRARAVREHWATIIAGRAGADEQAFVALLPLLGRAEEVERSNVERLQAQIRACEGELRACKEECERFSEVNDATASEFDGAGCVEIAREKRSMADRERRVVERIDALLGGEGAGEGRRGLMAEAERR